MTKEWIEDKKAQYAKEAEQVRENIAAKINTDPVLTDLEKNTMIALLGDIKREEMEDDGDAFFREIRFRSRAMEMTKKANDKDRFFYIYEFVKDLHVGKLTNLLCMDFCLDRYLDSEAMEFDDGIVITDPGYVTRDDNVYEDSDWIRCSFGMDMGVLGFRHWMARDTIYGDWSCTTFDTETGKAIGEFCADAGMVAVLDLNELNAYNPDFIKDTSSPQSRTIIPNFKGEVRFVVVLNEGICEEDSRYHKKGDKWETHDLVIVGRGVNNKTGEPINFVTRQTGF